jgi:peptidoglycan/xylan/chitin deacetylase (PgdA/CDA1 family)
MTKLLGDVENQGMTAVDWNAGAIDAEYPIPSKETIVNTVVNQCKYLKKAIILLHDSSPHSSSVEAVPEIIEKLSAMGFTFEPLTSSNQAVTFNPS